MNEKQVLRLIYTVSGLVFVAVIVLFNLPKNEEVPAFIQRLPAFNALVNGTCSVLLAVSWWMIRTRQIAWHKRLNITAFILSSLFWFPMWFSMPLAWKLVSRPIIRSGRCT